jgi:hypothetical protein
LANASITKHGLLPKLAGDPLKFLDSNGNWTTPAGGSSVSSVTYDNSLDLGIMSAGVNNSTYSCGGSDRILLLGVMNAANDVSATSVTFNGVPLTELDHASGGGARLGLWVLPNPDIGSHSLVITMPGTDTGWASVLSVSNSVSQLVRNSSRDYSASANPPNALTIGSALNSLVFSMDYQAQSAAYGSPSDTVAINLNGSHFGITYKASTAPTTTVGGWSGATSFGGWIIGAEIVF